MLYILCVVVTFYILYRVIKTEYKKMTLGTIEND
jgi:hypothetical protein